MKFQICESRKRLELSKSPDPPRQVRNSCAFLNLRVSELSHFTGRRRPPSKFKLLIFLLGRSILNSVSGARSINRSKFEESRKISLQRRDESPRSPRSRWRAIKRPWKSREIHFFNFLHSVRYFLKIYYDCCDCQWEVWSMTMKKDFYRGKQFRIVKVIFI